MVLSNVIVDVTIPRRSFVFGQSRAKVSAGFTNREIQIHVYGIRQTANVSWEFLRIENKQIKTVQSDSYG